MGKILTDSLREPVFAINIERESFDGLLAEHQIHQYFALYGTLIKYSALQKDNCNLTSQWLCRYYAALLKTVRYNNTMVIYAKGSLKCDKKYTKTNTCTHCITIGYCMLNSFLLECRHNWLLLYCHDHVS